jgi:hypothetical protein
LTRADADPSAPAKVAAAERCALAYAARLAPFIGIKAAFEIKAAFRTLIEAFERRDALVAFLANQPAVDHTGVVLVASLVRTADDAFEHLETLVNRLTPHLERARSHTS